MPALLMRVFLCLARMMPAPYKDSKTDVPKGPPGHRWQMLRA